MSDYGQRLQFGLFVTPDAQRAHAVLDLARSADGLGLDLLTAQDHPYLAAQLDTWTLLTAIGAQTSSIRLSPNVANLPLRPPVTLAKAAASLDLMTGGRVELGLGAGSFWQAVAAAGGPRRSPSQAVDALAEAIEVIRGFWDAAADGRSLRFTGEYYRAAGLHAGPAPAHRIPIWLGAYRPRMLRLTGRVADAWIPSMAYAKPAALADLNAQIDEAAAAAGRPPSAIRRMYNVSGRFGSAGPTERSDPGALHGSPEDWAEQLATLALEQGMDTFILACDDEPGLRRFAGEVVPRTRELVDGARPPQAV